MSNQCDIVEINLQNMEANLRLFADIENMINIFREAKTHLPPFKDFLQQKIKKKQIKCVKDVCV